MSILSKQGSNSLVFACLLFVNGCTSTKIAPLIADQPITYADLKPCLELRGRSQASARLAECSQCSVIVQPSERYDKNDSNLTGLLALPDDIYEITVPSGQYWYDLDRKVEAPQGDEGGGLTSTWLIKLTKHHVEQKWFTLMLQAKRVQESKPFDVAYEKNKVVAIDKLNNIIDGMDGELSFYVNDASWFYSNNKGRIVVNIKRMKNSIHDHCDSP